MKEIVKEIITKKTIFESVDGKEFSSREECEKYEESYIKNCFLSIPHIKTCVTNLHIPLLTENDITYILRPRNIEDVHMINQLLNIVDKDNKKQVTQEDIGVTLILSLGRDGLDSYWYNLCRKERFIENLVKTFNIIEENFLA